MIHITNPEPALRASFHAKNHHPAVLFDNLFRGNLEDPNTGLSGFPKVNVTDGKTNTGFVSGGGAPVAVATTTGLSAQQVDCMCIAAHTLGAQNATIRAQGWIGGAWVDLSDPVTVEDDATIMLIFPEATVTGVRLYISAFDSAPFIGVLAAGKRFVMKSHIVLPFQPLHLSEDVEMLTNISGNGNFLGSRVKRKGLTGTINLAPVDLGWTLQFMDDFRRHYNEGRSFFFASCPSVFLQDVAYCWREGNTLIPEFLIPAGEDTLVNMALEVRGYAG